MTNLRLQAIMSILLFFIFMNCATAELTMEIVPGQSVGKVKLGMSRNEVRSTLGEPKREFSSWDGLSVFVYESTTTGNTLDAVFENEKLCAVEFTSPDFKTADGISTDNVSQQAPQKSYLHLKNTDGSGKGWRHPSGGLIFTIGTDEKTTGIVYAPQAEKLLRQSYVTDETQVNAVVPKEISVENNSTAANSHWIGRYRFIEKWPGDPPFVYTLQVSCLEGDSCATLTLYGRQTEFEVICEVRKYGESLVIVYAHDAPETEFNSTFTKGDVLFSLDHQEGGEAITRWNKLESVYLQNREAGKYFEKMLPGQIERELPADLESDSNVAQEDLAVLAKPGVDLEDFPNRQPTDGMLVFKGLFIGMGIGQALQKIDSDISFTYSVSEREETIFVPDGKNYTIQAMIGGNAVDITTVGATQSEGVYLPFFGPTDVAINRRVEILFKALGSVESAVQEVIRELDAGLENWVQRAENGTLVASLNNAFTILATSEQSVSTIVIEPKFTNGWFNVSDMSGNKFLSHFLTSYKITPIGIEPELDFLTLAWVYTDKAGYKLTISDSKKITLERVASSSERRFD